jgi:hypothetical protein
LGISLERPKNWVEFSLDGIRFMVLRCLIASLLAAFLVGCSDHPVITVTNHSSTTLENLVISGSGFSEHIGSLSSGAHRSFSPHPKGESGLRVAFDALGEHHTTAEQGYFEGFGGYRVSVSIDAHLKVTVDSTLK